MERDPLSDVLQSVRLTGAVFYVVDLLGGLGGELVQRMGVAVSEGAHADSPSSLSKEPATGHWTPARPLQPRRA